uniref:SHSP domain-containing protein n=1 Tax=Glycine max TaxID=3847 RepID=K7MGK8_SOYBN
MHFSSFNATQESIIQLESLKLDFQILIGTNIVNASFRRDQLNVQVTSKLTLRLMGERLITDNRWHRFNLELPLLSDYDTDSVTAKFEGAKISIKFGELSQTKRKETLITPPSQKIEHQKPTQEDV